MHTYSGAQIIPNYAFEPHKSSGNPMFRIQRNNTSVHYRRSEFLVPHRQDYYFMAFIKIGSNRHWIDMISYTLKPNTFYFTSPHQVHLKEEGGPLTGISLSFTKDFLASDNDGALKALPIVQNPHNGHELTLNVQDLQFVEDILEKILSEYASKEAWQHTMLLSYMKILLVYLSRLYMEQFNDREQATDRGLLKKYLSRIDEAYTLQHEVAAYAEMLNISAGHLSDVVKEQSGKPAIAHIHERLILEAKRLLFWGDHSVKEIAWQLNFEDDAYFNRFFKKHTGQTPVMFQRSIREKYN